MTDPKDPKNPKDAKAGLPSTPPLTVDRKALVQQSATLAEAASRLTEAITALPTDAKDRKDALLAELARTEGKRVAAVTALKGAGGPYLVPTIATVSGAKVPPAAALPAPASSAKVPPALSAKAPATSRVPVRRPVDEALAAVDPDVPLVLFPVRLEVRFRDDVLQVRIYPDEILADGHEPELTPDERKAAERFWSSVTASWQPRDPREAWRELVTECSPQRAAWILRVTDPSGPVPVGERPSTWCRAVQAWLLPDSWAVRAVRFENPNSTVAGAVRDAESGPVRRPLALTLTPPPPGSPAPEREPSRGDELFDDGSRWTVDYGLAARAGMAVDVTLGREDALNGFDRVYVVGVYSDQRPEEAAEALARLLDAHHYTRGLAFVRQGTPTNNTKDRPAGYPPPEDSDHSYDVERAPSEVTVGSDAAWTAAALGIDPAVFRHVEGHGRTEQQSAEDMNRVLWPATVGYFLTHVLHPVVGGEMIAAVRSHFESYVRGRGTLPAIRVGSVPYGLLVTSSIGRWSPLEARPIDKVLTTHIRALRMSIRQELRRGVANLPRIGSMPSDPDRELLEVLGRDSRMRELRVRQGLGQEAILASLRVFGFPESVVARVREMQERDAAALGSPLGRATGLMFDLNAGRFVGPLVDPAGVTEDAPAPRAATRLMLDALREATPETLRAGIAPLRDAPTLLYTLVRHARAWELARLTDTETGEMAFHPEAEAVGGEGWDERRSIWHRLARTASDATLRQLVKDAAASYDASLGRLAGLPSAELERLLTETLDLCSHRIDAWESSLYAERLHQMRAPERRPSGCQLGAWGILDNVRPRTRFDAQTAGYVHAPSLDHAATASILLNAHRTYVGEDAERFRVDLSSARVRDALEVLAAVRAGQRFEDAVTCVAEGDAARAERARDAIGDLYTAESVFQIVRGNPAAGGASLDTLARGERPPDAEVVRSARGGPTVTHRVMLAFETQPGSPDEWAASETPRASLAPALDRAVGALLGDPARVMCRASYHGAREGESQEISLAALSLRPLDVLALARERPPAFGGDGTEDVFATELELRLAAALPAGARKVSFDFAAGDADGDRRGFEEVFEVARAVEAMLGEARPVRASDLVLPEHAPTETVPTSDASVRRSLAASVTDVALLRKRLQETEGPALWGLLLEAALYDLPEALPRSLRPAPEALRARADAVIATLGRRLASAAWPPDSPDAPRADLNPDELALLAVGAAQQRIATAPDAVAEALFGRKRLVLPELDAVRVRGEGERDALALRRPVDVLAEPDAVRRWLHAMWRVRAPLERWRRVSLYAGSLGVPPRAQVAQLEPSPHGRWCALPLERRADAFVAPPSGCVTLCRLSLGELPAGRWSGLLLDEWSEVIPNDRELTGVGFHYDDPGAEAPQVVLVAVPPVAGQRWTRDTLFDVLEDTFERAQVRAGDAALLGALSRVLPALYLGANGANDTVSTTFTGLRADAPPPREE
jgi:hypothetical protein